MLVLKQISVLLFGYPYQGQTEYPVYNGNHTYFKYHFNIQVDGYPAILVLETVDENKHFDRIDTYIGSSVLLWAREHEHPLFNKVPLV